MLVKREKKGRVRTKEASPVAQTVETSGLLEAFTSKPTGIRDLKLLATLYFNGR
jgi:hypothetical protein